MSTDRKIFVLSLPSRHLGAGLLISVVFEAASLKNHARKCSAPGFVFLRHVIISTNEIKQTGFILTGQCINDWDYWLLQWMHSCNIVFLVHWAMSQEPEFIGTVREKCAPVYLTRFEFELVLVILNSLNFKLNFLELLYYFPTTV